MYGDMYASDRLRERRKMKSEDPSSGDEPKEEAKPESRSVQLTDDEVKKLQGTYQPGEEAQCLVTGRIDKDGKLDIISVEPSGDAGGGGGDGGQMGQGDSMRMNPMMMPG